MNSLWNFDNGFLIPPETQSSGITNSWVPVIPHPHQSNWPEMAPISSGYLHEIPNPNTAREEGLFGGFDYDFSGGNNQIGSTITGIYQGIGSHCYPNGSLSDILASGDARYIPAMEQSLKRTITPEKAVLDLNFPADDSSVWPEFDSGSVVVPASSLLTAEYTGRNMVSQVGYDLNLTPENPPATANPVQFAPETPDQVQLERQELDSILNSLTEETVNHAKEDKTVNSSSDELLQNIVDPYMHKEGNGNGNGNGNGDGAGGSSDAFDLNKTPQQKAAPKRRKYTPKVVKENKPKRGRKTPNAKQAAPPENPPSSSGKRKYVRRKGVVNETPTQQAANGDKKNTKETTTQEGAPVKRALNFDLEDVMEATNAAVRRQTANINNSTPTPQVDLYRRSSVPCVQNQQQEDAIRVLQNPYSRPQQGYTLEDAVNQHANMNSRLQAPGVYYSRSTVQGNPQLHAAVSRQSGIIHQHRQQFGNLKFHKGTLAGMGRTASMAGQNHLGVQQCNKPGAVYQGRAANLGNVVNSRQSLLNSVSQAVLSMARVNQPSNGQQQHPPLNNPNSVWQRMLSTFPVAHQSMKARGEIAGRTDLPNQGRPMPATNDGNWGESGIFRNGFLQAMAEARGLRPQQSPHRQQLRTPSKEETSVVTQLHDPASMAPITPEKREMLKNQNAHVNPNSHRKRLDLSKPQPVKPKKNVQKGQRGRPPKVQPSASDARGPNRAMNYTDMVNHLTNRIAALNLNEEAGAIVLYKGGDGAIVPYEEKKRKLRPKVDLDPETNRVWNVLMGKEASEGEGRNPKKEKWWETERAVFRGRADSFIARMHLVQGDRRFSCWKGSVVDSVIGVFLTQNVSDHLSSSAFMALVARFPAKSRDPPCDNSKAITIVEPEDFMLNSNRLHPKFFVLNQSPMTDHSIIWRDCLGSPTERTNILEEQSHSTEEEVISSQGSSVTALEDLCLGQKSEGINGSTSKTSRLERSLANNIVSENGYSQSNYADGVSDGSYPPGFENQHFPAPSVSSNLHHLEMNSKPKQKRAEGHDEEITSSSSKRLKVPEERTANDPKQTLQGGNNQISHNSSTEGHSETKSSLESTIAKRNNVKAKGKKTLVEKEKIDWDKLRRDAQVDSQAKERSGDAMDSLDYEALRKATVKEISETIRERGMNNMLAERIKDFLERLVEDHGSVDLEWLRDVPPDQTKDYLLSIRGLGLKSVECVRLLTLHHLAFPVDTNVGRIAVRLGWVPLEPLPESLQLHLLEMYPMLESIQKYLWPRLCKLDQRTLYELHYQLITFGKVFCTKTNPNCNACPMRGDCRHFASAFASTRLALPGQEEKKIVSRAVPLAESGPSVSIKPTSLHQIEDNARKEPQSSPSMHINSVQPYHMEDNASKGSRPGLGSSVQPIIEEPASPEGVEEEEDPPEVVERDMEDWDGYGDDEEDEIPTIMLNLEVFTENLEKVIQENNGELDGASMSRALIALDPRLSSLPAHKLKNISRLRTEHQVYDLPDDHPLLERMQKRAVDDPSPYLLAIWTPGETANSNSTEEPKRKCKLEDQGKMCNEKTCYSCNSVREAELQVVRGTILIPCRTAMKGSFPLNGTYFQVNEMFADHESSINPIYVSRGLIWNLRRRIVYFGTSVTSIFRGLTTEAVQHCFWRGFVCVRGYDRISGAPRPLVARLHYTEGKATKKKDEKGRN